MLRGILCLTHGSAFEVLSPMSRSREIGSRVSLHPTKLPQNHGKPYSMVRLPICKNYVHIYCKCIRIWYVFNILYIFPIPEMRSPFMPYFGFRKFAVLLKEGQVVSLESQPPPPKPETEDVYFQNGGLGNRGVSFSPWGDFQAFHHRCGCWAKRPPELLVGWSQQEARWWRKNHLLWAQCGSWCQIMREFFCWRFVHPRFVEPSPWKMVVGSWKPFLLGFGNFWHLRGYVKLREGRSTLSLMKLCFMKISSHELIRLTVSKLKKFLKFQAQYPCMRTLRGSQRPPKFTKDALEFVRMMDIFHECPKCPSELFRTQHFNFCSHLA